LISLNFWKIIPFAIQIELDLISAYEKGKTFATLQVNDSVLTSDKAMRVVGYFEVVVVENYSVLFLINGRLYLEVACLRIVKLATI